jgi:dipeptidyl aminopeptidase/acylaminoacyl peptidase
MGLSGHSFGGYETNVLLTHSDIFRAAQESAGPFNLISSYSEIMGTLPRQYLVENSQTNLGTTPWSSPQTYLLNSPIFNVDKVFCPLLIMHNRKDSQVQFSQSQELFLALRRLGKPSWLISYQNEYHSLIHEDNQRDFMVRQQQFFDYYLKDKQMPDWMLNYNGAIQ